MMMRAAVLLCAVAPTLKGMWCTPSPTLHLRNHGSVEFVGVALADTLEAGVGTVRLFDERRRPVKPPRHVFGQRVRVQRVGVNGPVALRTLLSGDSVDVVLVPWGGDSGCGPAPWSRSARWIAPGARVMLWGAPRDRKHWVDGRPTFDVEPWDGQHLVEQPADSATMLTPDELLTFSDALPGPGWGFRSDTTFAELEPIRRWMREHPHLARREPARGHLRYVIREAELRRVHGIESPVVGTFRFQLVWNGTDSMTVFARTEGRPNQALFATTGHDMMPHADSRVIRAEGYGLTAVVARRGSALPSTLPNRDVANLGDGYFTVMETPELTGPDSTVWRGAVHVLSERLAGSAARARRVRDANAQIEKLRRGYGVNAFGRFVRYADGRVRFESDPMIDGSALSSIRGERIALTTMRDR